MSIGRTLLLLALASVAQAQQPQGQPLSADSDLLLLSFPTSVRLELGSSPASTAASSSVFTSDYWTRAYDERAQLETRFGIHLADGPMFRPYVMQVPIPGHPQFNFVQELHWPSGQSLTGMKFERRDLLFEGDHLSIRATSDVQTLFRGAGLSASETEVDLMSLLGWRSHSRLVWELGEPQHELQWQFTANVDRRAAFQSSTFDLRVSRRF